MKKRLLSMMLALALCLSLLPGMALAEDPAIQDISMTGVNLTNVTVQTAYKAGNGTITFTPGTDNEPDTITLDHATIDTHTPAIDQTGNYNEINGLILAGNRDYIIVLKGTNTLKGLYTAITSKDTNRPSVTITGDGTLTFEDCRTGINAVDQLVFDNATVFIDALEYGITTYGPLKVLNGSNLSVYTQSTKLDLDYGGGNIYSFYTNCAITAYNGDVEIKDSSVDLRTNNNDIEGTFFSCSSWGLYTGNMDNIGSTSIVIDNSALSINGYIYGIRDAKDDISIQNQSAVTIETGKRSGNSASVGIYFTGVLRLNDSSQLIIKPGCAVYSYGLYINKSGSIVFAGRSSAEITSTYWVTNASASAINFDSYLQFTNTAGEKEAAYNAKVNTEATADGAADWRHDSADSPELKTYKYVKITPQSPTITYVTNCDTQIEAHETAYGERIDPPSTELIRSGYTFDGWYTDANCTQAYDFAAAVTQSMTLYAKWVKNQPVTPVTPVYPTTPTYPPEIDDTDSGSVSVSPKNPVRGDAVTITPKPDAGYEVGKVTVTDQNGDKISVKDNGDGTYRFIQPRGRVTITVTFQEAGCPKDSTCPLSRFTDVSVRAWYHDGVHYVLEEGLMGGRGGGQFAPDAALTRAELAQILYNRAGRPEVTQMSTFTDVPATAWYAEAVAWAQKNEVVDGVGGNKFAPDRPVTREQIAVMLYNDAGKPDVSGTIRRFSDTASVSGWAESAVLWATQNKIIGGVSHADGTLWLHPTDGATRAEAAAMLQRYYSK